MDGPPLLAAFESNEGLLSSEDLLLRALSKSLKLSNEAGEAQSKTLLSVSESFVGLGRFECERGDDEQGILGNFRSNCRQPFIFCFSSIRGKAQGH